MKSFAQIVRQALKDKSILGSYLADRLKITRSYVSRFLLGSAKPPKADIIIRMSRLLDLDPQTMLCVAWLEKRPKMLKIRTIHKLTSEIIRPDVFP